MDVIEQFEKLRVSSFFIEARELLTEFKEKIYPTDYNYLKYTIANTEKRERYEEEWQQSIEETDIIHSLLYNINDGFNSDMAKVNSILNNPPENADQLRSETSESLLKRVDLYDQVLIEMKKFDISMDSGDGYIHIDWSRPFWVDLQLIVQAYVQSMYHFLMIQPDKMILAGKHAIELCVGEWQNTPFKISMMSNLTIYYRVINDVENALEIRLQIEKHLEVFVNQHGHIPKNVDGKPNLTFLGNYGTLGNIYMLEGELITAERYFNKVLDYSDSDTTHLDLARFYINSGRIDKAEYHLNVSQTKPVRNPDNLTEVDYLVGKARVNNLMGKPSSVEINSASDLIEAHLNEKEFVTSSIAIETYFHIAGIHMANSDLVEAKKNYYKVSEMCKIVHYFDFHRAECLMKLVQISCIEDEDAERDNYKTELDNLVDEYSSHGKMILFQKLAEAIILKHTKGIQRGISRFKAQEIFQKISQGKIYDINLHFFARFNYCELLLDAYQFYGEEEILDILVKEVEDLATISKEKVLILYNIEVLILRSKIATLQKDLDSSINFLEEAQTLADERNLITYQDRIKTEKETYLQNIDSWNSMRKDDKIEKLRLKQYLKFAQQNITK